MVYCNYPMPSGQKVLRRISPEVCEWHRELNDKNCKRCEYAGNTNTQAPKADNRHGLPTMADTEALSLLWPPID
uniref:Uncharacterized protein n=1 Tax=viral metagenome TaxID=1070528 RepID=A0A6H1ZET3_9ZZZZ